MASLIESEVPLFYSYFYPSQHLVSCIEAVFNEPPPSQEVMNAFENK